MAPDSDSRSGGDAHGARAEHRASAVLDPPLAQWETLARANAASAAEWRFEVAGVDARSLRDLARREALAAAAGFSAKLGVEVASVGSPDGLIAFTGHQPELYHPGVWVKDFALQRFAEKTGAAAVDLVVDSDGFESVGLAAPCLRDGIARCHEYLAISAPGACYASTPVPSAEELEEFCRAGDGALASLPVPGPREHFSAFCRQLADSAPGASNLAQLVTIARRRYEAPVRTDYLELPVTILARSAAFATFVADIALSATRFATAYNAELAEYRRVNRTRSLAQPFPDLVVEEGRIELPLWRIDGGVRTTLWAEPLADGGARLVVGDGDDTPVAELPADGSDAARAVLDAGTLIAPKALALTLFARVFCCDLFIHGTGGARYDRVTDGVCREYYGVEPPAFVVATITMPLALGLPILGEDAVSEAKERLNRLEHNPDAVLGEAGFLSAVERERAASLAAEKGELVSAIAQPDADKKALGRRIREVNAELGQALAPLRAQLEAELASLESRVEESGILADRTYPFCLFSPAEVAETVR